MTLRHPVEVSSLWDRADLNFWAIWRELPKKQSTLWAILLGNWADSWLLSKIRQLLSILPKVAQKFSNVGSVGHFTFKSSSELTFEKYLAALVILPKYSQMPTLWALQHTATQKFTMSALWALQHTATHCNTNILECRLYGHCNTLQHTATQISQMPALWALQHSATQNFSNAGSMRHPPKMRETALWPSTNMSIAIIVLQCVVVCCSVLQCIAVCCSVLQSVAVCSSVLQCVAVCCSVLQCVAVCCSVLQCVAE